MNARPTQNENFFTFPGLMSRALDSYLRAIGLLRIAQKANLDILAYWDASGLMRISLDPDTLVAALQACIGRDSSDALLDRVSMPWRGKKEREERDAAARCARATATADELAWFDACFVELFEYQKNSEGAAIRDNPLLGTRGSFGRGEVTVAHREALEKVRSAVASGAGGAGLRASLLGEPIDPEALKELLVTRKAFAAYQSGRGTGPGASRKDRPPTEQRAPVNAWDLVLLVSGLVCFRGARTVRPRGGSRHASFPWVVDVRAVSFDDSRSELDPTRQDFEFLAPLWSVPARPRVILHRIAHMRLRNRAKVVSDTTEALVVHAAQRAAEFGFDRLERFAFVSLAERGSRADRGSRYAVWRGRSSALASAEAGLIARDVLPYLRLASPTNGQEKSSRKAPASWRRAHRDAEELAVLAAQPRSTSPGSPPLRVGWPTVELLAHLEPLDRALVRARGEVRLPWRIPGGWWPVLCQDDDPHESVATVRVAQGLAWAVWLPSDSLPLSAGRAALLPHRRKDGDPHWYLDPDVSRPMLLALDRPLAPLAGALIGAQRRIGSKEEQEHLDESPVRLADLVPLLSGELAEQDLAMAVLAAARIDDPPQAARRKPSSIPPQLGLSLAAVLFAPYAGETVGNDVYAPTAPEITARRVALAELALAGRWLELARLAGRHLASAGLDPSLSLGSGLHSLQPARLALALLAGLDHRDRQELSRRLTSFGDESQIQPEEDHPNVSQ